MEVLQRVSGTGNIFKPSPYLALKQPCIDIRTHTPLPRPRLEAASEGAQLLRARACDSRPSQLLRSQICLHPSRPLLPFRTCWTCSHPLAIIIIISSSKSTQERRLHGVENRMRTLGPKRTRRREPTTRSGMPTTRRSFARCRRRHLSALHSDALALREEDAGRHISQPRFR